jgi:N-acetylglucosaminyl-diphospho-decaprenol L-rhamnosyltransferase
VGLKLDIVARMHGSPMLAVQIVNYGTRTYLERCLATVAADLERSALDYEINLLENASGEALDDLAATFSACRAFTSDRNLGFGGGHNRLAAETDAPYLLILNPDVEFISPHTAKRLLAHLTEEEKVKVAGPKLVRPSGEAQPYDHGRLIGLRAQISWRGGHSYWRETDEAQDVAWVSGAALCVEHAAFAEVGGFDQNLFLYKEDEDLCLRIRARGGRVLYEPSILVRHEGSVVANRRESLETATAYFFEKHLLNRRWHRLLRAAHRWLAYLRL